LNYSESLRFLNSFLNLEQVAKPHSRVWNLKRMRELFRIFGRPERGPLTVVVGGTKGKGSTGYFLSEILRQSGLRVGFYQSPHLEGPTERIWINGKPISRSQFARGLSKIQRSLRKAGAGGRSRTNFTYFEILTLLASLLFKEKRVKVAVFEVGMGGRLDATHVLPAKLALLTPVHFDHEAYLGNTLTEIANEKAAIFPRGRDIVAAPQEREVWRVIERVAKKRNCTIWPPLPLKEARVKLLGDFQRLNAAMALRAARLLQERFRLPVTRKGMLRGAASNHWPGRMELFKGTPPVLLDGAHNPKSAEVLARNLRELFPGKRKILIFGTSRDKRSERMLPALSQAASVCILTQSSTPRAKELTTLLIQARGLFPLLMPVHSPREALETARKMACPGDLIVATGSFYLIGELRPLCRR
jgi:dihydrofolate synthase/folylpolyglutamate synthase